MSEDIRKMIDKVKNFKQSVNEQTINGYETIAGTTKYSLVKIHNTFRIENIKGMYKKEVPYVEIPKELVEEFTDYLINYRDLGYSKIEGKLEFDKYCDNMFDEEHTELYPDSVL